MIPEPPLPARLWQVATGYFLPRCLHVIAELGVADQISDSPRTTAELARACEANADALGRILRALAAAGIFEARGDAWTHTDLSRLLRNDHPQSMRPFARMIGSAINWGAAEKLMHAARTGTAAIEAILPGGMWKHLQNHPDEARIFDAAMTAKSTAEIAGLLAAVDFTRYATIADIGGGRGHILRAVLDATPQARGILFDQADVVANATPAQRMQVQSGDFFRDALPAADVYLVSNVLHDWPDAEAIAILRAIHRACPRHAEVFILESLLPDTPGPAHSIVLDIVMLSITGGRERTRREYEQLLAAGGFRLDRVVPTTSPVSVIVGIPAG